MSNNNSYKLFLCFAKDRSKASAKLKKNSCKPLCHSINRVTLSIVSQHQFSHSINYLRISIAVIPLDSRYQKPRKEQPISTKDVVIRVYYIRHRYDFHCSWCINQVLLQLSVQQHNDTVTQRYCNIVLLTERWRNVTQKHV